MLVTDPYQAASLLHDSLAGGDPELLRLLAVMEAALPARRREADRRASAMGLANRDRAIRAAAAMLPEPRGQAVIAAVDRYRRTGWQRDRLETELPVHLAGTVEAHLWVALRAYPRFPTSERMIRKIIR